MQDIKTQADIELLIQTFYAQATKDGLIGEHFVDVDFEHHTPRIVQFWAFLLLGQEGITGNVFDKHKTMNIGGLDFARWVSLFHGSVDALFVGDIAEKAKQQASLLGYTFNEKMKYMELGKYAISDIENKEK